METTKTKNGLSIKHNLIGLGVIATIILGLFTVSGVMANTDYQPTAPAIQSTLDAFELRVTKDRCNLIKKLATAKLEDDMRSPSTIDRNDLAKKRDMNCDF